MTTTISLKRWLARNDSGVWGDEPIGEGDTVVLRSTDIDLDGSWNIREPALRKLSARERVTALLQDGDVVVVKSSGSASHLGKTALFNTSLLGTPACFSNFVQRLRTNAALEPRYLWYFLNCDAAATQIDQLSSTTTGLRNISGDILGRLRLPISPPATQRAIADYLDRETSRIDALIAAKRRMVELLEERWQGLREGLLSSVSASTVKLGRFVVSISQGVSPEAEARPVEGLEWGVLKLSAVKAGRFIPSEHKALPPDFVPDPAMVPRGGDLLVTRANTPNLVGDVCAVTTPSPRLMLCDLIYVLRLGPGLDPEYAAQALLTKAARGQLSSAARGTSQSMVKLRGEDVKSTALPVPPIEIQRSLVKKLNFERSRVDAMAARLERSITLLQERRQALITAAVTGQLDIPEAA